jgi:phosphoserine phosphatase RsbU/P
MLAILFLIQANAALSAARLRLELLPLAAAVVLFAFGAAAIILYFARSETRDLTLIYFGLFAILYALRLALSLETVRFSFGLSSAVLNYVRWFITCTIILPFELFLYQITSGPVRRFFGWVLRIQAVLSGLGIVLAAVGASLDSLSIANSISVLVTVFSGAVAYMLAEKKPGLGQPWNREIRIFAAGFGVWLLFIVSTNLRSLGIVGGADFEFLGFLVFACCLGYITASRSLAKEELLVTLNKELEIARQIQGSTLPREVPRVAGLEIAARYVPMSAVAGDFYDFLVADERRVGILVADVTGHGVPAALIASMLKVAFAGQAAHAEDPARVLTGLNRALCGKFEDHFVTAVYVFMDLQTGRMRYAGAGHPPLLIASTANGGVHPAEENGLMLGLFPDAGYTSAEMQLSPGDRCLLYTDGLFEAMNEAHEEFGKARVSEFLQKHSQLPASQLATALLEEISRWAGHATGRRQEDDITLLVLAFQKPAAGSA